MGRSQETFSKKEREKKKIKERQDKAEKMEARKAHGKKSKSLEDMMAYLDENGNLTSKPPDPRHKKVFKQEDMQIGVPTQAERDANIVLRRGVVSFFNEDKGFGFINDIDTRERIFVHVNQLASRIQENDKVTFEVQMGPKGASAVNVTIVK
jgi:cold shock CspA family protein